jgi:hypothetical protein
LLVEVEVEVEVQHNGKVVEVEREDMHMLLVTLSRLEQHIPFLLVMEVVVDLLELVELVEEIVHST